MNRYVILIIFALLVGAGAIAWQLLRQNVEPPAGEVRVTPAEEDTDADETTDNAISSGTPAVVTIAENLTIPWDIAFLPGGDMLVTERPGTLLRIDPATNSAREIPIDGVTHRGEGGLLGVLVHPDFSENQFIYLYITTTAGGRIENEVLRYRLAGTELFDRKVILEGIPGAPYHDGGRMAFGPDGLLYITTGDAGNTVFAQDTNSLAGKILRVTDDGAVPEDNPFGNAVYSYGHRNPQGLTWDDAGSLFSTEHGRSGVRSGFDELNLIEPSANYGWPDSQGDTVMEGTVAPLLHSGPSTTWAPASAQYLDGSIFFGGLRGATLYEAVLAGSEVVELREHFVSEFGRIRSVVLGPDDMLYLTTSNRDGRGEPVSNDDRIIRINPDQIR